MFNNNFQKQSLETYLQMYFHHSKYLAILRNQIYSLPIDEYTNVSIWEK